MKNAREFISYNGSQFCIPYGQFTITMDFRFINENMSRTVHGFYNILLIFFLKDVHIFEVIIIMP
ncbi:hypothetical protein ES703_36352 [subsurface metagenome]